MVVSVVAWTPWPLAAVPSSWGVAGSHCGCKMECSLTRKASVVTLTGGVLELEVGGMVPVVGYWEAELVVPLESRHGSGHRFLAWSLLL